MGSIQGTIVTWSFVGGNGSDVEESNVPMHVDPIIDGQDNFPANARDVFRQAFDDWQRVADITFVELTDGSDGDIRVGAHHFDDTALGHGFFPGEHPIAGDVHMRIDDDEWTAESLRAVGMHEIGHGIGLHHILSGGSGEIMHSSHSGNEINATSQDITYLQSIYGPPLPIIESIEIADDSGRSLVLRVNWSYPTEPLTPATFTRLHDGQVDVDGINRVAQVTVAAGDLHELLLFDLRHTPLQFQTITDGGEDNETAFDDVTPGLGGSLSWERTGFRVKTGSKAYRVDFDLVEFSGDFQLPQLVPVRATDTTVFRFQRAFFFTASQKIRYFVAVDDGEPILLQEETGSNNSNQADSPFTLREYDLSAHAGSNILVGFEYHNASAFENADNGVSIDDIELTDVFSATGTPVVLSNTIPATALPLPPTAAASPWLAFMLAGLVASRPGPRRWPDRHRRKRPGGLSSHRRAGRAFRPHRQLPNLCRCGTGFWCDRSQGNIPDDEQRAGLQSSERRGDLEVGGHVFGDFGSNSSRRLKENIRPIDDALEKIDQLQGVCFDWKADRADRKSFGFIAEDVVAVLPEAVMWDRSDESARGVRYGQVVAVASRASRRNRRRSRRSNPKTAPCSSKISNSLSDSRISSPWSRAWRSPATKTPHSRIEIPGSGSGPGTFLGVDQEFTLPLDYSARTIQSSRSEESPSGLRSTVCCRDHVAGNIEMTHAVATGFSSA